MIKENTITLVIERDGKYLLIRRAKPPRIGFWEFPGGHVDKGETLKEAAEREGKEEMGCEVDVDSIPFYILNPEDVMVGHQHKCHYFKARLKAEPKASSDAAELGWFSLSEMKSMNISFFTIYILNRMNPEINSDDKALKEEYMRK